MVSPVRYNSNNTFNEFCTMGDVGPSASGCPIGKRDNVSFTAGTRERKTVVDVQNSTTYSDMGFFFLPNK